MTANVTYSERWAIARRSLGARELQGAQSLSCRDCRASLEEQNNCTAVSAHSLQLSSASEFVSEFRASLAAFDNNYLLPAYAPYIWRAISAKLHCYIRWEDKRLLREHFKNMDTLFTTDRATACCRLLPRSACSRRPLASGCDCSSGCGQPGQSSHLHS